LEVLYSAPTTHEDFQDSDPSGMGQCPEELGLEDLKLTGWHLCNGCLRPHTLRYSIIQILL
jgi:hypothetical protein